MNKKIIKAPKAPAPVGPYNQGVQFQNLIFTAGQIPLDPSTGNVIDGGITEQTERVLQNLQAVLQAGGSSLEKIIKTNVFLKDMNDFAAMNAVYGKYFKNETAPARSTVQVARLPKDVSVEIEAVAFTE